MCLTKIQLLLCKFMHINPEQLLKYERNEKKQKKIIRSEHSHFKFKTHIADILLRGFVGIIFFSCSC